MGPPLALVKTNFSNLGAVNSTSCWLNAARRELDAPKAWIADSQRLQKRGTKINCIHGINEVTTIERTGKTVSPLTVKFTTDSEIIMNTIVVIRDKRIAVGYQLLLYFKKVGVQEIQWSFMMDGQMLSLDNYYLSVYPFHSIQKTLPYVPIDDTQTTDGVREAIDETFGYLVPEADPSL